MEALEKTSETKEFEEEFSFYSYFVPLTTKKAIIWIIIIGLIVYFNSLLNGFVWEDQTLIINNINGHSFNIFDLKNTANQGLQFRPVTALTIAILYSIFSNTAFFYHLIQLALHLGTTILLFFLFKKFFTKSLSFFLSLLFLIHPIDTESVVYFGALDNIFFTFLGLLGLVCCLIQKVTIKRTVLLGILLLLPLFTKETGLLFLLLILIYTFLFKKSFLRTALFLSVIDIVIYFLIRFSIGFNPEIGYAAPIYRLSLFQRLLNLPAIFFYYIKTFFLPISMTTDQIWIIKQINFQEFYFPLIVDLLFFIVLFALGKYLLKKGRKPFTAYLFFLIWFLSGMAVYSQIIPLNQTVADHWLYFPIIGLLGVIGIALQKLNFEKKNFAKTALTLGIIVIILFSVRSIVRNANWVDTMTLFIHDSKVDDNYDKEAILGIQYLNQSQYNLALEHFLTADNYYSYDGDLLNTASTYLDLGDEQKAKEYIQLAKAHPGYNAKNLKSDLQYAYDNESLYIAIHNPQKAPDFIQYILRDFPKDPSLWADLAIAYYTINDQNGALNAANKAKDLLPNGKTEYLFTQISSKQPLDINDLFR